MKKRMKLFSLCLESRGTCGFGFWFFSLKNFFTIPLIEYAKKIFLRENSKIQNLATAGFSKHKLFIVLAFFLMGKESLFAKPLNKDGIETSSKSLTNLETNKEKEKELFQLKSSLDKNLLKPKLMVVNVREPLDLIELVPVLRDINRMIPREFSLAEHDLKFSANEIMIQHQALDFKSKSDEKSSIITFSYFGDLGSDMETRLEVPLFYSTLFGFSDWSRYPFGNYKITINRSNFLIRESFYIRARAKF